MIYGVYSMRDSKTGFMSVTLDQNDDAAARNFSHAVVTSDGILRTHAEDFSLYRLGSFDTDSGVLSPEPVPVHVISGVQVLHSARKDDGHVSG